MDYHALGRFLGTAARRERAGCGGRCEAELRATVLALLIVVVPAITPLAYASPPDPLWIAGIYDGADFDEAVVVVAASAGLVEAVVLFAGPPEIPAGTLGAHIPLLSKAPQFSAFSIRAPPTASTFIATA